MATIITAILGILAFQNLPIDVFPDPSPPLVQIYTEAHGMAPEEIERLVSYPIESAMFGLPQVKNIRSFSTYALSIVNVYFEDKSDIYWARQLVSQRVLEVKDTLPEHVHNPVLGPIATGLGLVYLYYLEGEGHSAMELRTIQDWLIKYELKSVPEVSQVLSIGGDVKQFQILVNPQSLLKYNLSISDLVQKIRQNNQNIGASFITKGPEEYIVRSIGLAKTVEDLNKIVIANFQGTPLKLENIASVEILPAIKRGAALANGEGEKVVGMVLKLFGSNTAQVIEDLEEQITEINKTLPPGVKIVPFYNQASLVKKCFSTVSTNLIIGIALIILVLFLFMGDFPSAMIAVFSLPFCILFSFILMQRMNLAADLISFGGLALAIGLIADAAIILIENIHRHIQLTGENKIQAIISAGEEVGRPFFFAIIIIILVFLPIFTLTGVEGIMFRPMGYTISFALAGSLLFALISIPAFSFYFLKKKKITHAEILIKYNPIQKWKHFKNKNELIYEIEHRLEEFPGITLNMTQPIAHNLDKLLTGVKSQVAIKIYGEDYDILKEESTKIKEILVTIRGAADVQVEQFTGQNHLKILLNRDRIARYGLNIRDIQETIEAAVGGIILGQIYEEQKSFDIFLRFEPEFRNNIEQIENLLIRLPGGGQIPLIQIASLQELVGPRVISRENNKRFITIQCNIRGRDIGSFVKEAQRSIDAQVKLPPEYFIKWGGQFELQQRANRRLSIITPITLAIVALLLFTIFYSFQEVLIILINIPLALTGGILALKLSGLYLSVPASIGFIAIFGIALEDGLVLLSAFHRHLKQGKEMKEAILLGVSAKLRPVLMTTFTTIFGVMPLMLAQGPGAEIQRPLATVVVGGLITSTVVTLIVLPLVYQSLKKVSSIRSE